MSNVDLLPPASISPAGSETSVHLRHSKRSLTKYMNALEPSSTPVMFLLFLITNRWLALQIFASYISFVKGYSLVREYSGQNFFDRWNFYGGYDNTTDGEYSIHFM